MDIEHRIRSIGFGSALIKLAEQDKEAGPLQAIRRGIVGSLLGRSPRIHQLGVKTHANLLSSTGKARNLAMASERGAARNLAESQARLQSLSPASPAPVLQKAQADVAKQQSLLERARARSLEKKRDYRKAYQAGWAGVGPTGVPRFVGPGGSAMSHQRYMEGLAKARGEALNVAPWQKQMGGQETLWQRIRSALGANPVAEAAKKPSAPTRVTVERPWSPNPEDLARWNQAEQIARARRVARGWATPEGTGTPIVYMPGTRPPVMRAPGSAARSSSSEAATREIQTPPNQRF